MCVSSIYCLLCKDKLSSKQSVLCLLGLLDVLCILCLLGWFSK